MGCPIAGNPSSASPIREWLAVLEALKLCSSGTSRRDEVKEDLALTFRSARSARCAHFWMGWLDPEYPSKVIVRVNPRRDVWTLAALCKRHRRRRAHRAGMRASRRYRAADPSWRA